MSLPPELESLLGRVRASSEYLSHWIDRHPQRFAELAEAGFYSTRLDAAAEQRALHEAVMAAGDRAGVLQALREFRHRHTVRVAIRDIAGWATLDETMADLSDTADACCRAALERCMAELAADHGRPRTDTGEPVVPVILGMGKLGGRELNFSSDIDLIFCFSAHGETDGPRPLHTDRYWARVVQQFTQLLAENTTDGFAYRVDWRLRPFGDSGPPAVTFDALEHYYLVHGREWERYALIKARPVAGELDAGRGLLKTLRPFVYRRYLDYNAIGALRELKQKINAEIARRDLSDHIKLGPGGIREVEFVVQAFQLVRGGQEPALRNPSLRPTLAELGHSGLLDPALVRRLDAAYVFLRRLENALQWYQDRQVHRLPQDATARRAVCIALGFPGWSALGEALAAHQRVVRDAFAMLFDDPDHPDGAKGVADALAADWDAPGESPRLAEELRRNGCQDPDALIEPLAALLGSRGVRALSDSGERMLRAVLSVLLVELAGHEDPRTVAPRVMQVLDEIVGRTTYLALLRESEVARSQLIRLCAASPWITRLLAQTPALLDSLLDPRTLYNPPDRDGILAELSELREQLADAGTEQQMDALRRFRQEITLRVAAADVLEALPLVKVSDRLSWLAEALVQAVLDYVRSEMVAEYGTPLRDDGEPARLGVIGYGKLGGIEMGYGSDLDLVFLHDATDPERETEGGQRPIANAVFFSRMTQRIVNWLSAQTAAGRIYEVDLRLRPSGSAGLLVSSLDGFRQYQAENAWTWEHQALVRARPVAGSQAVGEAFERIRRDTLTAPRDAAALRHDVRNMREKMRRELSLRADGCVDVKQMPGGLTDVEFLTQYLVLRHCHAHPELVRWTDNWRQTDALVLTGILGAEQGRALIDAYREYRAWLHARDLQQQDRLAPETAFVEARREIAAMWTEHLGGPPGEPPDSVS